MLLIGALGGSRVRACGWGCGMRRGRRGRVGLGRIPDTTDGRSGMTCWVHLAVRLYHPMCLSSINKVISPNHSH
jgi:hypothetical protein